MAVSAQSAALRSTPGYVARPSTTSFAPPTYTPPALPSVPSIDDARAPNAAARQIISNQLGAIPGQLAGQEQNLKASTQQALAGYGGFSFGKDDPSTPQDESLYLNFDAGAGLGEREKAAVRDARNSANAAGMLHSSFANENIGAAVQKLSLEAQQIALQYAGALNQDVTNAANQAAQLTGQWAQLYGQDATYLTQNPPPPPDPLAGLPAAPGDGSPIVWRGAEYPNLDTLRGRYPGYPLGVRQAGDGSYVVVIGAGAAKQPTASPKQKAAVARVATGAVAPPASMQPAYGPKLQAATAAAKRKKK